MTVKERIAREAATMFVRNGIKSITMDDIACTLGVSKRTIYELFKDKNELLTECLEYHISVNMSENRKILAESQNMIEAMLKFLKRGTEAMEEINFSFFTDLQKHHPKVYKDVIVANRHKNIHFTVAMLQRGIDEGVFRSDIKTELVAITLREQIDLMAKPDIFPYSKYSKSEVFTSIIINFTRGISTPKGTELMDELLRNYKEE
ncbi:MAG: TetR/AcrR family transcriptional regulator [Bacteroidales bacterium]|nr:TetR/AcrR family transcriptional regulator [Bacteroidales bacterium]MBN2750766.1 TetR/AcrR family transcriptional regulator [Bacteroidales bacterium]